MFVSIYAAKTQPDLDVGKLTIQWIGCIYRIILDDRKRPRRINGWCENQISSLYILHVTCFLEIIV